MTEQNAEISHGKSIPERQKHIKDRIDQTKKWLVGLRQQTQEGQLSWEQYDHLIARAMVARERYADLSRRHSLIDRLTQIPNRRWLDLEIQRETEEAKRSGQPLGLLIIDIDHFKRINDLHGHPKGDQVLQETARTLQQYSRAEDFLARYGGEEFAVLVINSQPEKLSEIAERLRLQIERLQIEGISPLTISLGGTSFKKGEQIKDFFARADNALYQSKERGRNKVTIS
ncbi:MAG: GGDEF domain-containing protein [Patescibacteria group bacterium]|nr:GGDEF domain-containing protein [Patescibacteria group bacterium]MCL5095332.1 GGDEF domain-containing protein [Patescibacteria group bacterium]